MLSTFQAKSRTIGYRFNLGSIQSTDWQQARTGGSRSNTSKKNFTGGNNIKIPFKRLQSIVDQGLQLVSAASFRQRPFKAED